MCEELPKYKYPCPVEGEDGIKRKEESKTDKYIDKDKTQQRATLHIKNEWEKKLTYELSDTVTAVTLTCVLLVLYNTGLIVGFAPNRWDTALLVTTSHRLNSSLKSVLRYEARYFGYRWVLHWRVYIFVYNVNNQSIYDKHFVWACNLT